MEQLAMEALRSTFRPEFLNRVDATLMFHRLSRDDIRVIVDIQLARVQDLLSRRQLELELTDAAKDFLAQRGYEPAYGARPLKRALQELVMEPLSEQIIAGQARPGDRVVVDLQGGALTMTAAASS
ncbi:hypothetical protein GW813_14745, partial [bacterium]|nr:hypothetical protein [bacterium]